MIVCKRCRSVDDYHVVQSGPHKKAICNCCGNYIQFLPQQPQQFWTGKYKGVLISEITDGNYLDWVLNNWDLKPGMKKAIESRLSELKTLSK